MLQKLFRQLCARRGLALSCVAVATLLFVLASALQQGAPQSLLVRGVSLVLMLGGVLGQLLGIMALMRSGKR